jgi:hypothetical protein
MISALPQSTGAQAWFVLFPLKKVFTLLIPLQEKSS